MFGDTASSDADPFLTAAGEGFRHILPDGLDHIAFLLGLFFLARGVRSLLWQVTYFTLAHSFALGLVLLGLLAVPSRTVEVAVALTIAFVAVENLSSHPNPRWRTGVICTFGLVHGLAFAHNFPTKFSDEQFLPAMFGFNFGIELGQVAVIGLLLILCGNAWDQPWYRRRVAMPASFVLALFGVAWAVQRAVAG